jgi:hypothetical protein
LGRSVTGGIIAILDIRYFLIFLKLHLSIIVFFLKIFNTQIHILYPNILFYALNYVCLRSPEFSTDPQICPRYKKVSEPPVTGITVRVFPS